ncbi:hypothetical protein BC739_005975 [Kutzneria viridogrisea]|uniref:Uncharacterized protein n=1 Tax=Kutzneria viridogrisea TaxID=47990 RepID=A0ABR6BPG8_9PSEU|nr:hypothetical protein [Kutzneria viridogrisea]
MRHAHRRTDGRGVAPQSRAPVLRHRPMGPEPGRADHGRVGGWLAHSRWRTASGRR